MMNVFILFLFAGSAVMSAPTKEECPRIMREAGISPEFPMMVSHTIHSLTLEDIRYYFKSDATEDNGIPIVNYDLAAEKRVLPNAPLIGYDEDFSTMGLKTFDMVMRHMNQTSWATRNPTLVQILHTLHMRELWEETAEQYKIIEHLVDPESDTCACVTDIENNDVLNYLHLVAFKLRYPGLSPENVKAIKRAGAWFDDYFNDYFSDYFNDYFDFNDYDIGFKDYFDWFSGCPHCHHRSASVSDINFEQSDFEILEDVAQLFTGNSTQAVPLDSSEHWKNWRDMVKSIDFGKSGYFDIALFIYCTLN